MFPAPIARTIDVRKSDMVGDVENEAVVVELEAIGVVGIEAVGVVGVSTVGIGRTSIAGVGSMDVVDILRTTCISQVRHDEGNG